MYRDSYINLDYPDPDVIRVEDTYYMVTTTMHFMPGCEILRSYDLVHWEHASYVYERLDGTPAQRLEDGGNIYGKGMWAASLRYHKGCFYVCFVANDTGKTYLYTAKTVEGPWEKRYIEGFYHDCSLLFEEDDSVYIVYGNRDIYLTQLEEDLSGPKRGGLHRMIISDAGNPMLGYEGAHFYKREGRYYVFLIHSLRDKWRRVEACFAADSLDGEFVGGDIFNDDMGYCGQGIAQGGIVDTPEGNWYAILFQDRGAVGRIPVLIPMVWKDGWPILGEQGKMPKEIPITDLRPHHIYMPLVQSDDFKIFPGMSESEKKRVYGCFGLKSVWQFNHEPELTLMEHRPEEGELLLRTGKVCIGLTRAANVLTQRMVYPGCLAEVTVNFRNLQEGDYAGLCALQGCYGFVGVTKREGKYYLVMVSKKPVDGGESTFLKEEMEEHEYEAIPVSGGDIKLRLDVDFTDMKDEAKFLYFDKSDLKYKKIGITHKLYFKLDHFTGCRFGLFIYSAKNAGGEAVFSNFVYKER